MLEWNPSFGPIVSAAILLGAGFCFYLLARRLVPRHGPHRSALLLAPKILLVALLVLALLDPDLKFTGANATPAKVIILQDISSSMDLRDEGSHTRTERASSLIHSLESSAPSSIKFEVLPFDTALHPPGYRPAGNAIRGTDLALALAKLGSDPKLADADGTILVTDGGDETVELAQIPTLPLAIVGVGNSPDTWNDIGIGAITAPTTTEENSQFDLEAELYARPGTHADLGGIEVTLDQWRDGHWTKIQSQSADLISQHAAVNFSVRAGSTGAVRYRVRLPELPGELTYANNSRTIDVQVQQRALHVLYFTEELGVDYKYLRAELGTDPGVVFTAMYRVMEDQFTVQGDRTGYQDLAQGFPVKDDILKRYDCIILGSFPASQFTDAQEQALVRFVQNGGALILLGGENSFGHGGYADSKLAPLVPWAIRSDEPDLTTGTFPVTLDSSGESADFTSGLRDDLTTAGGASVASLNQPGGLRPGAIGLLDAATASQSVPLVAWQHFGKGQVLGIATDTLWRWAAAGHATRDLYGRFWRQAVRGLTRKLEGGSLLGIHWNRERYRPGEEAVVEIQVRSDSIGGNIRLTGTLTGPDGQKDIEVEPVTGQADAYSAKVPLAQRGDYTFHLSAYAGGHLAESYERTLPVAPLVEEGANPELKEAYLRDIAARARGIYTDEKHLDPVRDFLRRQVMAQQAAITIPLVDFWNIFPFLILLLLLSEWFLRRRYNLI